MLMVSSMNSRYLRKMYVGFFLEFLMGFLGVPSGVVREFLVFSLSSFGSGSGMKGKSAE